MRFLIDAQLPRRTVGWLKAAGRDAVHTLDLPDGNHTTDIRIIEVADREQRAVVTKDADFVDSHILHGRPVKLLLVSTGNISNANWKRSWRRSWSRSCVNSRRIRSSNLAVPVW